MLSAVPITDVRARSYRIPTDAPEADGTLEWAATTLVMVEVEAGGSAGLGYSYADAGAAGVVHHMLAAAVRGQDALATGAAWRDMVRAVRNIGRRGIAACAIAAVDMALWDLKARLLEVPLARLLGMVRNQVPIYGSGGFTTYSEERLSEQLAGWVANEGCRWVKMKVGADPQADAQRVRTARAAIGDAGLFIDANGAYDIRQALALADEFAEADVRWFEEPVSSDDLAGLALMRRCAPSAMAIAAGEYIYESAAARQMLAADAVDVLQLDATRCGGYTGFLALAALAAAFQRPLSTHTAPSAHLPLGCAVPGVRHLEWFHDHVRIERLLFDGVPQPRRGVIAPALDQPGHGLAFRHQDAERLSA